MKYINSKILESIQRGINLAIDDIEDVSIEYQKKSKIENNVHTRDLLQYVDLDLPSGTLWAKYNVDVNPNKLDKPEDWYGGYYAWGEIESKEQFLDNNYKYMVFYTNPKNATILKYCPETYGRLYNQEDGNTYWNTESSSHDGLTELLPEDDVASIRSNGFFKMPTDGQIDELIKNTTHTWVKNHNNVNGLHGMIFKSKNGNSLFIPAGGYKFRNHLTIIDEGEECNLWSSTLVTSCPRRAFIFYIAYGEQPYAEPVDRNCYGFNIRGVVK